MNTSFRLLIYAIAAAMLVSVFYFVIYPILFPAQDNTGKIENGLDLSQVNPGKAQSFESFFVAGSGLSAETFDNKLRNVIFQCNKPELCCPLEEECVLSVEWGKKFVKFNKGETVNVSTRCEASFGIFTCAVYFGQKPAQLEISSISAKDSFDLDREEAFLEVTLKNTGLQESENTEIEVTVKQLYLQDNKWLENDDEAFNEIESVGTISPDEEKTRKVYLKVPENGRFKAYVRVFGTDAGFDERTVLFEATGVAQGCKAAFCSRPSSVQGRCISRCECQDCLLGSECVEKIEQADPVDLMLSPGTSFEGLEKNILGSNLVEVVFPAESCG